MKKIILIIAVIAMSSCQKDDLQPTQKVCNCGLVVSDNVADYSVVIRKVDDPRDFYLSTGIGETNPIIQNMINSINPIYYIVLDDGIGTLKRKNILSKDIEFSEHFTKFA